MATEGVSINLFTWSPPVTGMKSIACVRLSNWWMDRVKEAGGGRWAAKTERVNEMWVAWAMVVPTAHATRRSLVLVQTIANRQVVVAMCSQAREKGVRVGFSLAQARRFARSWCMRMTIRAGYERAGGAGAMDDAVYPSGAMWHGWPAHDSFGRQGLFLDLTGTQRLFGSLEKLLDQIAGSLAAMGSVRVAIAPTMGAAWALTYATPPNRPIVTGDLATAISPLPPVALRLEDRTLATLHHLGLEKIGQILKLPRQTLPARFGPLLLQRIDEALGNLAEPLTPLPFHAPIEAAVDFDGVVDSLEALWLAFKDLIAQVTVHLVRRGLGAAVDSHIPAALCIGD